MLKSKNILIVHNGALGDFLCAWPGILAIVQHLKQAGSPQHFWFAGRDSSLHWLKPLGIVKAPAPVLAAVDSLYFEAQWPKALADTSVFWFALKTPVCQLENFALINLPILDFRELQTNVNAVGLPNVRSDRLLAALESNCPAVMQNLFLRLNNAGISWPPDFKERWPATWKDLFGKWTGNFEQEFAGPQLGQIGPGSKSKQVGLIPGAGHIAKQWPLEKFELLAQMLDDAGYDPVYLLGPVEQERNILPQKARAEYPSPPPVLAQRMLKMRAVIACDAGPAHLAAMHGVPGVVLFGPTCARTWAPAGLELVEPVVDRPTQYAPIVNDPKDIDSSLPSNINLITPEQVMAAFLRLVANC